MGFIEFLISPILFCNIFHMGHTGGHYQAISLVNHLLKIVTLIVTLLGYKNSVMVKPSKTQTNNEAATQHHL